MTDETNPLRLKKIHYVEFYVGNAKQAEFYYRKGIAFWRGRRRTPPYALTEQGVAMLSSVLNSDRAVQVNIAIMRGFVNMRRLVATNEVISKKLDAIERKLGTHDDNLNKVFAAIRAMMAPERQAKQSGYIQKKK